MKQLTNVKGAGIFLLLSLFVSGCRETFLNEEVISSVKTAAARLAATDDHPGKLLAANCFQCHGTNGNGLEHLAGQSANEIAGEMREMQTKNPRADIMNVHAKAYTTDEIKLIADFFSKQ
ncbi:MAG: hypothetical protein U0X91_19015 [Spirosomataceae bacterium]